MAKETTVTGKRQPGQTSRLPRPATALDHLVVSQVHPLMLQDVDTRKLAIDLPCRRGSRKFFTWLPSAAGLFGHLSSQLRTHIFQMACTFDQPFCVHAYRGRGKLSHGPYRKNGLEQVDNARALSAVSKAIRHETSQLFYQINSFSINHDPYCPGNDATSVLKRFRDTIGEEAFLQIKSFSFTTLVTNIRVARTLPPPQDTGIQLTEALKAIIIAGGIYCLDTQSAGARIEICLVDEVSWQDRALRSEHREAGSSRFATTINLSLRLPACTWERHLDRWSKLAVEAEEDGDGIRKRGIDEIVAGMRVARERLRTSLPLQSRF